MYDLLKYKSVVRCEGQLKTMLERPWTRHSIYHCKDNPCGTPRRISNFYHRSFPSRIRFPCRYCTRANGFGKSLTTWFISTWKIYSAGMVLQDREKRSSSNHRVLAFITHILRHRILQVSWKKSPSSLDFLGIQVSVIPVTFRQPLTLFSRIVLSKLGWSLCWN